MNTKDIIGFLFGRADAIRAVASSSSAIWIGIVLVLLTAFARNYDQTYYTENPVLWLLGPLMFSLVSGTWLFCISYAVCARFRMAEVAGKKPAPSSAGWRGFMGAFWMTAPVAWLYAIPVERFLDSYAAAQANMILLSIVSLWRVLLMARVMQVVCAAPFLRALLWVLLPAAVEVVVVGLVGGGFEKRVLAGMGGMRNSPEEELMFRAVGNAVGIAFYTVPAALLLLALWRWRGTANEWPAPHKTPMSLRPLLAATAFWIGVTVPAQLELRHNVIVEGFVKRGEPRQAIDYMNQRQPSDFAPSRALPPKLYELTTFSEVPRFVGALQPDDAPWILHHGLKAASVLVRHLPWRMSHDKPIDSIEPHEFLDGLQRRPLAPEDVAAMLKSLSSFEGGREWLKAHAPFLEALAAASRVSDFHERRSADPDADRAAWIQIAKELHRLGHTNAGTDLPASRKP